MRRNGIPSHCAQSIAHRPPERRQPPMLQILTCVDSRTVYSRHIYTSIRVSIGCWYLSIHARSAGSNGTVSALRAVVRGSACGRRACRFEKRHIPGCGRPASACTNKSSTERWAGLASTTTGSTAQHALPIGNASHKYQSSRTSASRKAARGYTTLAQRHLMTWAYTSLFASTSAGARSA